MKKLISHTLLVLFLSGCGLSNSTREINLMGDQKPALRSIDHLNPSVKMDVIDEIPSLGIIVIRFIDAGHTRYIAIRKDSISVLSETKSGKHNYEESTIMTVK
jgi:hypothetical protein